MKVKVISDYFLKSEEFIADKVYIVNNSLIGFGDNHYGVYSESGKLMCLKECHLEFIEE